MKDLDQSNRVTVITGGSSGIGRQISLTFAEHGSDIAILDMNESGEKVVSEIKRDYKREAAFFNCDITDFLKVQTACDLIIKKFKKIDNLILAAGYSSKAEIEELSIEEWKKSIDINVNGLFYVVKCMIEQMLQQKKANIILIGSGTVVTGSGGGIHYSTSKVAQYGFLKGLSYELLSRGIRTNIITPHIIDTPMLRKRYPDTPEVNARLAERTPIGRIGLPSDIANIALFLASEESGYICGSEIVADGGALYYLNPKK
jgi:3-oxoacyl-[acyl-carrier protein] reductase